MLILHITECLDLRQLLCWIYCGFYSYPCHGHETSLNWGLTLVEGVSTEIKQQRRFEEIFFIRFSWTHVDCIVVAWKNLEHMHSPSWKTYFLETGVHQIHIWRWENVWTKTLWILKMFQIQTKAVHTSTLVWISTIPTYRTLLYTTDLSQRGQTFRCN